MSTISPAVPAVIQHAVTSASVVQGSGHLAVSLVSGETVEFFAERAGGEPIFIPVCEGASDLLFQINFIEAQALSDYLAQFARESALV